MNPHIDPKSFFENQAKLFGEEKREGEDYEDFCKACARVMATESGKSMMNGLKRIVEHGSTVFRLDDDYNTHAAAARDGAHGAVTEILLAAELAKKAPQEL